MKKILSVALFATILFAASCERRQPYSQVRYGPNGEQIVYVQDGYGGGYWMPLLLFNQMYSQGGYGAVHTYYTQNPAQFQNQDRLYSNYTNEAPQSVAPTPTPQGYSSPSRVSTPTTTTTSSATPSSYSSPSRQSTQVSRPAQTTSYSSPSRQSTTVSRPASAPSSYSSPSRSSAPSSYSSPSRSSTPSSSPSSYSSPSRSSSPSSTSSYSSPGRGR